MVQRTSRRYGFYVVGLLTAINLFNYVDRLVIVTMLDDLRAHFHFTDDQFGAFWMSFFLVHAVFTFPLGWLADRVDRRKVIGFGIIAWSLATLGSAYAWGFVSMLLFRSAIGIGEAAYGAPANALLCEPFPEKKSLLVGIFNTGMIVGAVVGMALGASLGFPHAFQVVAIPGFILGILVIRMDVAPRRTAQTPGESMSATSMLRDGLRALKVPTLRWMLPAGILISFAAGGYIEWITDFTIRYKGLTMAQAVPIYGFATLTGGGLGVVVAGWIADRLQRTRPNGRALTMMIGFALAVPFSILVVVIDHGIPYFVCGWFVLFFLPWYNGPMAAIIDDVVDDQHASTAQATFVFFLHLIGTGPGGLVLGFISRYYSLRYAFYLPAIAIAIAAFCSFMASRHVAKDVAARNARAARPDPEPARLAPCVASSS